MSCYLTGVRPCTQAEDVYAEGIRFAVRSETCGEFFTSEPTDVGSGRFDDWPATGPIAEPAAFGVVLHRYGSAGQRPWMEGVLEDGVIRDVHVSRFDGTLSCTTTMRFETLLPVASER